jgi:transposase
MTMAIRTGGAPVAFIQGTPRDQMRMVSLEDMVGKDSVVRAIDRFVDVTDLAALGFKTRPHDGRGRPAYPPSHLTRLYLFGYLNGVRSSRRLERCCSTDVEAMWLVEELAPDFKTIADFRKDNIEALTALFSHFTGFLNSAGLLGGRLCAIDGTKVKASNSKKTNFSKKKLDKLLAYHGQRASEYLVELECADTEDGAEAAAAGLARHEERIARYTGYREELEESGQGELSEVDPDSRLMGDNRAGVSMAHDLQAAVDAEHNLAVAIDIVQTPTDHGHLSGMAAKANKAYGKDDVTDEEGQVDYLADKGYFNGEDLLRCEMGGLNTIVARQDKPGENDSVRKAFSLDKFSYDPVADSYTCPGGHTLGCRSREGTKDRAYHDRRACDGCAHRSVCLPKKAAYRKVVRTGFSDAADRANRRYAANSGLYRRRQQIVEPVFGVLKRAMGFEYFLLRTREKVLCEASLAMLCYNIKRAVSAKGFEDMMEALDKWAGGCPAGSFPRRLVACLRRLRPPVATMPTGGGHASMPA